jgi:hypothetical protein
MALSNHPVAPSPFQVLNSWEDWLPALAQELIGLRPDIILTSGAAATVAVRREKVATAAEVRDAIGDVQKDGKRAVLIRLKSDNVTKFVAIPIART